MLGGGLVAGVIVATAWALTRPAERPPAPDDAATPPASVSQPAAAEATAVVGAPAAEAEAPQRGPTGSATPATGLHDGATVRVSADHPYLTDTDRGFGFCAVGVAAACTHIPVTDHIVGDGVNEATFTVPQRFTTWDGDTHDCVADGPCELRLWALDRLVIELRLPVLFAAGEPAAPTPIEVTPLADLPASVDVTVMIPTDSPATILQCVSGLTSACDTTEWTAQPTDGVIETIVEAHRLIFTPRGPHDCTGATCELRFVLSDAHHADPQALHFLEPPPTGRVTATARPASGLTHGDPIELRTPGRRGGVASYSLCSPDEFTCALLGTRAASEELVVNLPRWIESRIDGTITDCGVSTCVIRTTLADALVDVPIVFAADERPDPPPVDVVVSRDASTRLRSGDSLTLAARGLFVLSSGAGSPTGAAVRFCEAADAPPSACLSALVDGEGLQPDGSLLATVVVPDFDRRRTQMSPDGTRSSFCQASCWIVVEPRVAVPGGAIEIEVAPPDRTVG